ncbi:MAG: 50S ribosomal protein L30 [Rhodothermales bacterium]
MAKKIKITQTKSAIDSPRRQRRTLEALGIRGMHQTVELDDSPAIRGMLIKVKHLVDIDEA